GIATLALGVAVGKPPDFFRTSRDPDDQQTVTGLVTKDMNKTFHLVLPNMRGYLADYIGRFRLVRCIDLENEEFIWPIPLPALGDEPNAWTKSSMKAMELARDHWFKLIYDRARSDNGYRVEPRDPEPGEPEPHPAWSKRSFRELRNIALADFVIKTRDHPVAIKCRQGKRFGK